MTVGKACKESVSPTSLELRERSVIGPQSCPWSMQRLPLRVQATARCEQHVLHSTPQRGDSPLEFSRERELRKLRHGLTAGLCL